MKKIDRRKNYYLLIDTEATNIIQDPKFDASSALVYDVGMVVIDKKGNVYESHSLIVKEVFDEMPELMATAYYANKLPLYYQDLDTGYSQMVKFFEIRKKMHELVKEYKIKAIIAHNMPFDYKALSATQRYLTSSKYRWFFPFGIPLWDTMRMAEGTLCKQKMYRVFCEQHGYITKTGQLRKTAEILYKYITYQKDFIEEHTGLADALIEKEIFAACMKQNKKMRKLAFGRGQPMGYLPEKGG